MSSAFEIAGTLTNRQKQALEILANAKQPLRNKDIHERFETDGRRTTGWSEALGPCTKPQDHHPQSLWARGLVTVVDGGSYAITALGGEVADVIRGETKHRHILDRHRQLEREGKLSTPQELARQYALFKERFGPAALSRLDGEALLTHMHDQSNRDSLVYWLEFKNDEEFQTLRFGSIAGGSALKFRIFRRKDSGIWQDNSGKGNQPKDISIDEAVEYARAHRDQLIRGVEVLDRLPENPSDEGYAALQTALNEAAPDVGRLAWGHKYFNLLFPHKLEDYHTRHIQDFHQLKLLQLPPKGEGLFLCTGRFLAVAKEVGFPLNELTVTLNALHGRVHRYWRIGTTEGTSGTSYWQIMRERGRVAVGWPKLGDISWVEANQESREKLRLLLEEVHPNAPSAIGRACSEITNFVAGIAEGDIVLAADGMSILGIGRVVGGYEYDASLPFPHQRPVEWLTIDRWEMPDSKEGLRSTVRELGRSSENLLAVETRIQTGSRMTSFPQAESFVVQPIALPPIVSRIQSILERKGQVILYGPPGTGKTYWAERAATDLAALSAFGRTFESLAESERLAIVGHSGEPGQVRLCCFHPGYGYEDFLEGYRPNSEDGKISFVLRDGVFKRLCKDAAASPGRNFYLIVDEINRGDIPRIFGELLTTLEKDKRGKRIVLPLSQELFAVPKNVFLVGTMNTADRSISLLDAALRRRFGFVELMPDASILKDSAVAGVALRAWLDALNKRIREHVGRDARNLQIGHSYLMHAGAAIKDVAVLKRAVRDDIIPLLEEYCYEDFGTLVNILGPQMIDVTDKRIRHELFDDGQENALVQALLAPFDISASMEAIAVEESNAEESGGDGGVIDDEGTDEDEEED